MHPLAMHLILVAICAAGVLGHLAAAGTTPAVRFWEEVLPSTPMPKAIADLVQQGIEHSPLVEHYHVPDDLDNFIAGGNKNYGSGNKDYRCLGGCPDKAKVLPGFFFLQAQVRVGRTMTVYFPAAAVPPILPRDVANKVPFNNLPDVLAKFNIAPSSAEAAKLGSTLSECQALPLPGEQKACTTSLEGTVLSAMRMLGTDHGLWAAASALPRAGLPLQAYAIQAVTPLDGERHAACHNVPYPYAVYLCHMTGRPSKAYVISLRSLRGGAAVSLAAICHLDTSNWNPAHPAFEILHTHPGGQPVCHFMTYANPIFGEKAANV